MSDADNGLYLLFQGQKKKIHLYIDIKIYIFVIVLVAHLDYVMPVCMTCKAVGREQT